MNHSNNHLPLERGKRVKRLRNLANIDRKKACDCGNFSIATLKNWELGRYGGINDAGAKKILSVVKNEGVEATYEWLMFGLGPTPKLAQDFENTPLSLSSRNSQSISLSEEEKQILHELSIFKDYYHDIVHLQISDDTMYPIYEKGDYVAGIKLLPAKIKNRALKGLNCIIKLKTGEIFVKTIKLIKHDEEFYFGCANKNYKTEKLHFHAQDITYIAPITRHYKSAKNL